MNWIRLDLRLAIYARDHFDCVWCRQIFPVDPLGYGLTLDHVDGPSNAPENLVTACNECNASRKDLPLAEWLRGRPEHRRRLKAALARPYDRALGKRIAAARRDGRGTVQQEIHI